MAKSTVKKSTVKKPATKSAAKKTEAKPKSSAAKKPKVTPKAAKTDEERAAAMPDRQEPDAAPKAAKIPKDPKPEPIKREPPPPAAAKGGSNIGPKLADVVNRVESLESEKQEIAMDIKAVMQAAKGDGLDTKAIKEIVRLRKRDAGKLREEMDTLDSYMLALGMI